MTSDLSHYDIGVIGSGFAGVSAALTSARKGKKTVLVSLDSGFGGVATKSFHLDLCGFYLDAETLDQPLNNGIQKEIERILKKKYQAVPAAVGRVGVLKVREGTVEELFKTLLQAEPNLTLCLNTRLTKVFTENGLIHRLQVQQGDEEHQIAAAAFIDASAGQLTRLSGADYSRSPAALRALANCSVFIRGVFQKEDPLRNLNISYVLSDAVNQGIFPHPAKFTTWTPSLELGRGTLRVGVLPSDEGYSMSSIRSYVESIFDYIRKNVSDFRSAKIECFSSRVSEREGIRAKGKGVLSAEDVLSAKKQEEGDVKNAWPIEFWSQEKGPQLQYLKKGDYYELANECLRSKTFPNLFAAGSCISADPLALSSIRVTGACLAMGEASARLASRYATSSCIGVLQ